MALMLHLTDAFLVGENSERDMTTFAYSFCIAIYGVRIF